jgi:hypothetical protein
MERGGLKDLSFEVHENLGLYKNVWYNDHEVKITWYNDQKVQKFVVFSQLSETNFVLFGIVPKQNLYYEADVRRGYLYYGDFWRLY